MPSVFDIKSVKQKDDSSYSSCDHAERMVFPQEHGRPKVKKTRTTMSVTPHSSSSNSLTALSNTSLTDSISKFRNDFEEIKCKMRIFGESLNLCQCIASDFKNKLTMMERRLHNLEKRQKLFRTESNYSAIIQKNKRLSAKTLIDVKKLQMCGTEEEMREVAGRICRNYLHGAWQTVDPSELNFSRINGGLSNFLYYVALPDDPSQLYPRREMSSSEDDLASFTMEPEPKKVLIRIYGQVHGERAMDAIVTESVIFTLLSERRLGPKLHGVFSGGRIEEFIPARPLLTKELADPALSMKIAEKMAAIHSMDVPLSKEPTWLWKSMGKWLKTVREERLAGNIPGKSTEEQRIVKYLRGVDFEKEVEWLKKFLATVESPVVFCHNDMQEGNILLFENTNDHIQSDDDVTAAYVPACDSDAPRTSKEICKTRSSFEPLAHYEEANTTDSIMSHLSASGEPNLVLIDFEYCAYNYRGFDLANHFQEWGYDYSNPQHPFYFENQENCPTMEQKEIFIKEYLKHYHMNLSEDKSSSAVSLESVNKLLNEVEAFALASHLFWALWSIVNASKSQIPFGYWEYSQSRLDVYLRLKQEVIKKDKFGLGQKRKICEVDI